LLSITQLIAIKPESFGNNAVILKITDQAQYFSIYFSFVTAVKNGYVVCTGIREQDHPTPSHPL
jgi:hypothetical protein